MQTAICRLLNVPRTVENDRSMSGTTQFNLKLVGAILRETRTLLGLSIRQLSAESGVSPSQILRLESGEYDVRLATLMKVVRPLGLPAGLLMEQGTIVNVGVYAKILGQNGIGPLFRELAEEKRTKGSMTALIVFCARCCEAAGYLLNSSNARKMFPTIRFPFLSMEAPFAAFAAEVDSFLPDDRLSVARELSEEPFALLQRKGLVSPDIARRYIATPPAQRDLFVPMPDFFRILRERVGQ